MLLREIIKMIRTWYGFAVKLGVTGNYEAYGKRTPDSMGGCALYLGGLSMVLVVYRKSH